MCSSAYDLRTRFRVGHEPLEPDNVLRASDALEPLSTWAATIYLVRQGIKHEFQSKCVPKILIAWNHPVLCSFHFSPFYPFHFHPTLRLKFRFYLSCASHLGSTLLNLHSLINQTIFIKVTILATLSTIMSTSMSTNMSATSLATCQPPCPSPPLTSSP